MSRWEDFCGIVCGPPKRGKTSLAAEVVSEALADGVLVLAHDPKRQFRGLCAEYENADAWREAARKAAAAKAPMPLGASIGGSAADVTALAMELGKRFNDVRRARVRILLVFDEGSLLGTSGSSWIGATDNELLGTRRHLGIAMLFLVQRPSMLTTAFWEMATDAYLFLIAEKRLDGLTETIHLPQGALAAVSRLPPFKYVHISIGDGIAKERL